MTTPRRPFTRRLLACGLAAVALLLGGCVYLRLLEFKLQLNKFEKNFALRTTDGLAIICQKPVIRPDDVRWFGVMPETIKRLGTAEEWQIRWVKQLPPGVTEKREYDIIIELGFSEGRMSRVAVPERYFAVMPKEFLVGVIKSFGRGKVDQAGKSVQSSVAAPDVASARPTLAAADQLLGIPTEKQERDGLLVHRYRYQPATKESRAGVFDMVLHFDPKSGDLVRWQAVTPVGKLGFDFARTG